MDSRLTYSPEHYRTRLSTYAKDTIEYESPTRLFKYKINKNGNPTVAEELNDYFKIYESEKPEIRLVIYYPRSSRMRTLFFAKVYISNDDVVIQVVRNRWQKAIYVVWIMLIMGMGFLTSHKSDFGSFLLFLPLILFAFLMVKIGRRHYKTFIINFMNTIAAS